MRRLALLFTLAVLVMPLSGCIVIPLGSLVSSDVHTVVYQKGTAFNPDRIAIIDVSGVLTSGGAGGGLMSRDSSVVDLDRKLAAARKDKHIKALVLRVDSPGGGVTASDTMHRAVQRYREDTGVPVYASMQSVAASGGYYISMAADEVYATPTTVTGSIGVIAAFLEVAELMDRFGVRMNAVTTGDMKDAGAFYKSMGKEDRELYQALINDMYDKFIAVVQANRDKLSEERIRDLADGRVYTADQALDAGLIDGVMYLDEVLDKAKEEVGGRPTVVLITRSSVGEAESAYAKSPGGAPTVNLINLEAPSMHPATHEAFNYLWVP